MASVKVIVTALRRYWAAGRSWEAGETEAVLEDDAGGTVASKLAQLDAARGGKVIEQLGLERSNPEQRAPCVLSYRIVEDPPPAPHPFESDTFTAPAGPNGPPELEPGSAQQEEKVDAKPAPATEPSQDPPSAPKNDAPPASSSQTQPPAAGEGTTTEPPPAT